MAKAKKDKTTALLKAAKYHELHSVDCGQGFQKSLKSTVCRDGHYDKSLAGSFIVENKKIDRDDAFAECSKECVERDDCHGFEFSGAANERGQGNRCELHLHREVYVADMGTVSSLVHREDDDFICCLKL